MARKKVGSAGKPENKEVTKEIEDKLEETKEPEVEETKEPEVEELEVEVEPKMYVSKIVFHHPYQNITMWPGVPVAVKNDKHMQAQIDSGLVKKC